MVWTIENDIFIMQVNQVALMWREIIRKFGMMSLELEFDPRRFLNIRFSRNGLPSLFNGFYVEAVYQALNLS